MLWKYIDHLVMELELTLEKLYPILLTENFARSYGKNGASLLDQLDMLWRNHHCTQYFAIFVAVQVHDTPVLNCFGWKNPHLLCQPNHLLYMPCTDVTSSIEFGMARPLCSLDILLCLVNPTAFQLSLSS